MKSHFDRIDRIFDKIVGEFENNILYGPKPAPPSPSSVKKCCDKGWGLLEYGLDDTFYISYGDSLVHDVTHCPWCGTKLEKV